MEKRSWKRTFFTIQSGQAISLITSSALQMALIFYLTEKTNSSMTLALACVKTASPVSWRAAALRFPEGRLRRSAGGL